MSEELNIYQRMHKVMQTVSYVQKEDKKVNNQYRFVSHDAVTAKIRPALVENGILPVTRVVSHDREIGKNGMLTTANIEVDFVNVDKPEDRITVPAFGYGIDNQDKGPGKAVSYAFKYACLKTFALETGDDPERDMIDHIPEPEVSKEDIATGREILESASTLPELADAWKALNKQQRDALEKTKDKLKARFERELEEAA